jgi:hypothetical protein
LGVEEVNIRKFGSLKTCAPVMLEEMDFKNVIYVAARDGKLRRLKVSERNYVLRVDI